MAALRHLLVIAGVASILPLAAHADIIVLKNGQRLEGRVELVPGRDDQVRFVRGTGAMAVPRARINEIIEEPDSVDFRRLGDQLLTARAWTRARESYNASLKADPNDEAAKAGLAKADAAIAAENKESQRQLAIRTDARIEEARKLIKDEKFSEAESLLKEISTGNPTEAQRTAAQMALVDLHSAWGFQRLDRLDFKGAEVHYMRVLEMDPNNKQAREQLLDVWKDDPSKREEVLKAYQARLREDPDNLENNARVADLLTALNRYEESIIPLEKLFGSARYRQLRYDERLRTALAETIRGAREAGDLDKAIGNMEKLLALFPAEDSTQLSLLRYRKAVSVTDPKNTAALAALIQQLAQQGLFDFAVTEAVVLSRRAPEDPIVKGILRQDAERRFAEIQESMQREEFLVARDMARTFVEEQKAYPDLIAKASEIYERAQVEAERQRRAAREQAREVGQRGIEYLQQAYSFADQLRNVERNQSSRPFSPKQEAIKFARRSIDSIDTALRIDPSLGPVSGMDLVARRADATELLSTLTQGGTPSTRYNWVPGQTRRGSNVVN